MSSKPPRLDLAAAMEAELNADALGPRSAWGTPPSGSAHATHGLVSPETAIPLSQEPSVTQTASTSDPSTHETARPLANVPSGPISFETIDHPSHGTPAAKELYGGGDTHPRVTPAPSPMRLRDGATGASPDRPDEALLKRSYVPPSRQGAVRISAYCSARVMKQVRMMAVNQDCTIDDLVTRALDLLFKAEGLPAIAFDGKPFGRPPEATEKGAG